MIIDVMDLIIRKQTNKQINKKTLQTARYLCEAHPGAITETTLEMILVYETQTIFKIKE